MSIFLGIHVGHNASVSLMKDGKILFALQEERFVNQKNFMGFPEKSLHFLKKYLEKENLTINEAGFSTINQTLFECKYPLTHFFSIEEYDDYYGDKFYSRKLKGLNVNKYLFKIKNDKRFKKVKNIYSHLKNDKNLFENSELYRKISKNRLQNIFKKRLKKISFLDHHTCHAYYGKFSLENKEKKFAVIVLDSIGDGINQSIWVADKKNHLKNILRNRECDLGRIYKFVTLLLNLKPDEHEFKVMGMAPYAKREYYSKIYKKVFKNILKFRNLSIVHNKRPKDLYQYLKEKLKFERFDNIAGALQFYLEKMIIELVNKISKKYKIKSFFFSGGVSMNIKMYNKLAKEKRVKKIYNAPSGGDESISIGACYYLNRKKNSLPIKNLSLGQPLLTKNEKLEDVIVAAFAKKKYKIQKNTSPEKVAKLLIKNKIIALANGREEFGARALGNRSIVSNPSDFQNIQRINSLIKNRDFWMPFALTIRNQNINEYLINPKKLRSDFMNLSFDTKKKNYQKIIAGCHPYDRSVRPQFLRKEHNAYFYNLITEFGKLSGNYVLLNTSLNLHGDPKCSDAKSIIRTFKNSGLEYLYFNNNLLIQKV